VIGSEAMRIKVTKYYQGFNTNQQMIREGIYQVGDERLFGIEDYLVTVQHKAEYIEDDVLSPSLVADGPAQAQESVDEFVDIEHKGRTIKAKKAK
jgi:hypothetical protein